MIENLFKNAKKRGKQALLPYTGAFLPSEADFIAKSVKNSYLIDVRTKEELIFVGYIPYSLHIEWQSYYNGEFNSLFLENLKTKVEDYNSLLMFICRSGARSHSAAALAYENEFKNTYNILEGFEGDLDANFQRGKKNGWKFNKLIWKQE